MQDESGMHLTQSSSTKNWAKLGSSIKCFHGMKPNNRVAQLKHSNSLESDRCVFHSKARYEHIFPQIWKKVNSKK